MRALLGILAALIVLAGPVLADETPAGQKPGDQKIGDLTIRQPWSRATAPGAEIGVVYLTIVNRGAAPDRLIAVSTPVANSASLHRTDAGVQGMTTMEPMPDGVTVPPGQTVALKPGGMHVMLMGLAQPLKLGETVPLTLTFEKAGKIDVNAEIAGAGPSAPPSH